MFKGPAVFHKANGEREERTYVNGELEGESTVYGVNGDRLVFSYKNGRRCGLATYYWWVTQCSNSPKKVALLGGFLSFTFWLAKNRFTIFL